MKNAMNIEGLLEHLGVSPEELEKSLQERWGGRPYECYKPLAGIGDKDTVDWDVINEMFGDVSNTILMCNMVLEETGHGDACATKSDPKTMFEIVGLALGAANLQDSPNGDGAGCARTVTEVETSVDGFDPDNPAEHDIPRRGAFADLKLYPDREKAHSEMVETLMEAVCDGGDPSGIKRTAIILKGSLGDDCVHQIRSERDLDKFIVENMVCPRCASFAPDTRTCATNSLAKTMEILGNFSVHAKSRFIAKVMDHMPPGGDYDISIEISHKK